MAPKTLISLLEMYMKATLAKIPLKWEGIPYLSFRCSDRLPCVKMSSTLENQVIHIAVYSISLLTPFEI